MKLYHSVDARSLRPLWALEEMGLPYELEVLPFPPRVLKKDFLALNPLGTIPYLIDGDIRMTESSGICHYLVERYGKHQFGLRPEHPEYGIYINCLFQSDATLTFPQTVALRYELMEPPERRLPQAVEDYKKWYLARLRLLSAHLLTRDYLCDGRFTIADICIGYALFLGTTEGLDLGAQYAPQVQRYLARLLSRPALLRARALGA
ncbi:MAG: glutathione S-transferase family protein [Burkholderiales bacterium]|nr:glutathione S-transferase family protein [Burkholderiales bacterium]